MEASRKADRLVLNCYYRIPEIDYEEETIKPKWCNELITLDQLQIAPKVFKPYYVPYADRLAKAEEELLQWQRQEEEIERQIRLEDERQRKEEAERLAAETAEFERLARLEREQRQQEEERRLREEAAARLAQVEADRKAREERDRLWREEQERRAEELRIKREAEEQARLLAEAEQKRHCIEQLLQINPDLDATDYVEWSLRDLEREIQKEEQKKAEIERAKEELRKTTALYYRYKNAIKNEVSRGQIKDADGNFIASKKMTEYCIDLLKTMQSDLDIDDQQLLTFGYAIAGEFGQSGREYFISIGLLTSSADRWKLTSWYKHCIEKIDKNNISIRDFWMYCFSNGNPDWLGDLDESQVA